MTALGIRYLRGCAVASDTTRRQAEWPPHFGRVFMAMAAAHFETRGDTEERGALEWLERQTPGPSISAPAASERTSSKGYGPIETYVPVNDKHGGLAKRSRQARSFPTLRLRDDKVFLIWHAEAPTVVRTALEKLCSKVTRIGHSSSLVQMWVVDQAEDLRATWIPDEFVAERRMRSVEAGVLANLESAFAKQERPRLSHWQGYRALHETEERPAIAGVFDPRLLIFEKFEGRMLGLESTLQLTGALRNAAMRALPPGESPEWLSGHQPGGTSTTKPHVAFLPLPFVEAKYADGHVLGLAMAIPRSVPTEDARAALGAFLFNTETGEERTVRLWRNDGLWDWSLRRETRDRPPYTLLAHTWTEPSNIWASVTPVVLHHFPKKNREEDVKRILEEAFISAGLPKCESIETRPTSRFEGALHARSMPPFTEGGSGLCCYQTHVVAQFEQAVEGPVLVGRGRYRGYGLFRPLRPRGERANG